MEQLKVGPRHAAAFFSEDLDGETLLYRLGSDKAIYLNTSAALVWKLCDGTRTVHQIVELLRDIYPDADLTADVEASIHSLVAEGVLIEPARV